MVKFACKLLFLLSVLLMPLGMQGPAQAAAHHSTSQAVASPHCPDQQTNQGPQGGFAECTMACAAALPAVAAPERGRIMLVCLPPVEIGKSSADSVHPDTATPPPKSS